MHKMGPAIAEGLLMEFTKRYKHFVARQCAGREGGSGQIMVCISVDLPGNHPEGVIIEVVVQYHGEDNPLPKWIHLPTGWFIGARDRIPVRYVEWSRTVPLERF